MTSFATVQLFGKHGLDNEITRLRNFKTVITQVFHLTAIPRVPSAVVDCGFENCRTAHYRQALPSLY